MCLISNLQFELNYVRSSSAIISSVCWPSAGAAVSIRSGSAIGFLHKVDEASRKIAFGAIFTLSAGCLAGVYLGIAVSEHQLLSPLPNRTQERAEIVDSKYLRSYLTSEADQIDQLYASGALDAKLAYERLYALIKAESTGADQ